MFTHLTLPQYIYLFAVVCYVIFAALFLRLFLWKRYADRQFWRRRPDLTIDGLMNRARSASIAMPRFSVLIPARNEADVIERTVDHMCSLQYPKDLYEVVIVTDEKEALAAEAQRKSAVAVAATALRDHSVHLGPLGPETKAGGLVLALFGALALEGFDDVQRRFGRSEGIHLLRQIPGVLLRPLVWETSDRLLLKGGRRVAAPILRSLRTRLPELDEEELQSAYAALLALAIPSAVAYHTLRGGDGHALGRRLASLAAQAHHTLTREIMQSMSDALAADLMERLDQVGASEALEERLAATYREIYPTTQNILARKVAEFEGRDDVPALKHVTVPRDFDGDLGGRCLGVDVPSTKGRALNWALSFIDGRSAWCAFFDAESRPDVRSLLYVAYRTIEAKRTDAPHPRIFQGPVFQVRNWYEMGPFCKIASLYQCISHDWYLPVLYRWLPFVGGTNVFVEASLLTQIGGFDSTTLTEDLELGTRAYLKADVWPEYLPYPSSEQTPPTFVGFYRQRLRWATGHLQVMNKIQRAEGCDEAKRRKLLKELLWKGQIEWICFQAMALVPPVMFGLWTLGLLDPDVLGKWWHMLTYLFSAATYCFTIYIFFRYLEHLDKTARPRKWLGQLGALAQLLILPLVAPFFPVPYSSALVLTTLGKGPVHWTKTPRTKE